MGKAAKQEIIIIVDGGLIQDVKIPKGCNVRVRVRDFDIEGCEEDEVTADSNGDEFIESVYEN